MQLSEEPFVMLLFFFPFFSSFLFGWPTLLCLFVYLLFCFFPRSPVLKGDESILCFSVWEKFQQQTFL